MAGKMLVHEHAKNRAAKGIPHLPEKGHYCQNGSINHWHGNIIPGQKICHGKECDTAAEVTQGIAEQMSCFQCVCRCFAHRTSLEMGTVSSNDFLRNIIFSITEKLTEDNENFEWDFKERKGAIHRFE